MSQTKAQLIDNLIQPITGALGSAAAPTFSFTADPNTGLFSPGADAIALATAGTNRLHITSAGLVGIGTTSPSQLFHCTANAIIGGSPAGQWSTLTVSGDAALQAASPTLNFVNAAGSARFGYLLHGGTGGDLYLLNQENGALRLGAGNAERARIDSSGRLLVGTSSASGDALLQVNGASRQAGVYSTAADRAWDMAGATALFDISFGNQGNFAAEFTWILQDIAASNFGTRIGKFYIAAYGSSSTGPTAATVAAEDKTSSASGTLPTITWAVSVTGGKVRLTGTPSSDSGNATIYLWGSSPLLSEITAL